MTTPGHSNLAAVAFATPTMFSLRGQWLTAIALVRTRLPAIPSVAAADPSPRDRNDGRATWRLPCASCGVAQPRPGRQVPRPCDTTPLLRRDPPADRPRPVGPGRPDQASWQVPAPRGHCRHWRPMRRICARPKYRAAPAARRPAWRTVPQSAALARPVHGWRRAPPRRWWHAARAGPPTPVWRCELELRSLHPWQ
jgi:hypothetical protein